MRSPGKLTGRGNSGMETGRGFGCYCGKFKGWGGVGGVRAGVGG